jgi:hypothetical protein
VAKESSFGSHRDVDWVPNRVAGRFVDGSCRHSQMSSGGIMQNIVLGDAVYPTRRRVTFEEQHEIGRRTLHLRPNHARPTGHPAATSRGRPHRSGRHSPHGQGPSRIARAFASGCPPGPASGRPPNDARDPFGCLAPARTNLEMSYWFDSTSERSAYISLATWPRQGARKRQAIMIWSSSVSADYVEAEKAASTSMGNNDRSRDFAFLR